MGDRINRRKLARGVSASVAAASFMPAVARAGRVLGANERVRIGCIGVGNRGVQVLRAFHAQADAQIIALADVYEPYLHNRYDQVDPRFQALGRLVPGGQPEFGNPVDRYKDFRQILDRKDIDAVIIATPDHWHAIQTIKACEAGKDVYVEKPLSITIREGRRMVEAARKANRVVQVGTQRRSSALYAELAGLVHAGALGKVTVARAYLTSNMAPAGIGIAPDSAPPEGLDWDMWLGPRPMRPYNANIAPYKFRWWHLYSSQMANWGVHYTDVLRWLVGETAPVSCAAIGGRYAVKDARTIPDTAEVIFELPSGMLMIFGTFEASGRHAFDRGEIELRGTLGTAYADLGKFEILPERGGQFQDPQPRMKAVSHAAKEGYGTLDQNHARNFLDCVKSRKKPNADIEEGHRSTTFAHVANIALATRARLDWDPAAERFTNSEEANALLDYEYRKPWSHA